VPGAFPVHDIHHFPNPAEIKVFFGDWCTDSKKHVPALIKTMEFADNKNIQVEYIDVSRDKTEPSVLVKQWNIEKVPTIIVLSDGKEAGRIVETPKKTVDQDLDEIFTRLAPPVP
jgi:thiol-disulfide isomerase/thioredoxin